MSSKRRIEQKEDTQSHKSRAKLGIEHILTSKIKVKFRTESQQEFWNQIDKNEIALCSGPAGTGKSFISITKAIDLLLSENNKYEKIIIIKPVVEADEKLGFLPGDLEEKLAPYTYSTLYIFEKLIGKGKVQQMIENGYIEMMALAYLRGVNVDNAILVFEEAQNCTRRQMKTMLTRIGENAKFIVSGDLEQNDRYADEKDTGLYVAMQKLKNIKNIGIFEFKTEDIIRNPLIGIILEKLNGDKK